MSVIRAISAPSLPVPPQAYTAVHQNILTTTLQHFGTTTANAVNQLLKATPTSPNTVVSLPKPAGVIGNTAYVTDGATGLAWGATVTGGGSTTYLVWSNGLNWTVIGK
jgi:hypothetical protein